MYLFMNLGAFFVLIVVKNKTEGETFDDFKGLGWEMPFIGIIMTLFMIFLILVNVIIEIYIIKNI